MGPEWLERNSQVHCRQCAFLIREYYHPLLRLPQHLHNKTARSSSQVANDLAQSMREHWGMLEAPFKSTSGLCTFSEAPVDKNATEANRRKSRFSVSRLPECVCVCVLRDDGLGSGGSLGVWSCIMSEVLTISTWVIVLVFDPKSCGS